MPPNDLSIYDNLAESWWQTGSQLNMLARVNPARFTYFESIVRCWQAVRVLDLGCGGGLATTCLAQRGAKAVGLDPSQASLRVAHQHTRGKVQPEPVFACGRAEALPFADASFDIVWCTDVLEHLADVPTAMAQIVRILKPGGLLLYDTINRTFLSRLLVIWFWEYLAGLAPRGTHDWRLFIKPQELQAVLRHYGLQPRTSIQGILPLWGRQGWRFRLTPYTGVLYLGAAIKEVTPVTPLAETPAPRQSSPQYRRGY